MTQTSFNTNILKQGIEQMNLMRIDDYSKLQLRPSSDSLVCNIPKRQSTLSPEEKETKELYNDPYSVLRRLKDEYFFKKLNRKTTTEELRKLEGKINQAKHFCGFIKGYYNSDYETSSDEDNYDDDFNEDDEEFYEDGLIEDGFNESNEYNQHNETDMYDVYDDLYDEPPVTEKNNNDGFTLVQRK